MVDTATVNRQYDELVVGAFPYGSVYYAVKASRRSKSSRCCATGLEFRHRVNLRTGQGDGAGCRPERISYGNTIKKSRDIRYFCEQGCARVRHRFEADRNIAKAAPGITRSTCILTEGTDRRLAAVAQVRLPDRSGDGPADHGLKPGPGTLRVSFHVGSQQHDIGTWDAAIAKVKVIFERLREDGIELKMINMGGGFPAKLHPKTSRLSPVRKITRYLHEDFGDDLCRRSSSNRAVR